MRQIPVGFPKKIEEKIRQTAKKRGTTLSHFIRELVEIGLQVEEAAAKNLPQKNASESSDLQQDVWKKTLTWLLEIRYLMRYCVEEFLTDEKQKHSPALNTAKDKAEAFVKGLFKEEIL